MATVTKELFGTEKDTEPRTEVAPVAHNTAQPETVEQRMTGRPSTVLGQAPTWLHENLRSLIAIALTGLICWLALTGNKDAMTALIAAFSVLMGAIWGERAALKVPGRDA